MTPRRSAWILVALLWVVALLNYVDRQVIFSVFPLLSTDLGLDSVQLGLLSTIFLWIYGLLSPVAGYVADRFGRARLIGFSLLVWSAVTLATGFAQSYGQLILARGLMGVSEACYLPAALALIARRHGAETRSLAVGVHQSGLYVGMIFGGAIGGWAGERYGWRVPFLALGAVGIVYVAILAPVLRRAGKDDGPTSAPGPQPPIPFFVSLGELLRVPGFLAMTAVFSAMAIANWLVYTWLPLYLYERFHMSLAEAGFTATFYIQGASFAGILAGGWLADRWSAASPRGRIYTQAAGLLLASPFLFVLGQTDARAVLIAGLLLFGAGRGFYDCNTMPVLADAAGDRLRSTGYGVFNLCGCLAGGAVAALAGALKQALGLAAAFQVAAVILFASALLLLRIKPRIA